MEDPLAKEHRLKGSRIDSVTRFPALPTLFTPSISNCPVVDAVLVDRDEVTLIQTKIAVGKVHPSAAKLDEHLRFTKIKLVWVGGSDIFAANHSATRRRVEVCNTVHPAGRALPVPH
jgi:hypothetical protein